MGVNDGDFDCDFFYLVFNRHLIFCFWIPR